MVNSRRRTRAVVIISLSVLLIMTFVSVAYAWSLLGRSQLDQWCKVQLNRGDARAVFESFPFSYGWKCHGPNAPTVWAWLNANGACQYFGYPSAIGWNENGVYCND